MFEYTNSSLESSTATIRSLVSEMTGVPSRTICAIVREYKRNGFVTSTVGIQRDRKTAFDLLQDYQKHDIRAVVRNIIINAFIFKKQLSFSGAQILQEDERKKQ